MLLRCFVFTYIPCGTRKNLWLKFVALCFCLQFQLHIYAYDKCMTRITIVPHLRVTFGKYKMKCDPKINFVYSVPEWVHSIESFQLLNGRVPRCINSYWPHGMSKWQDSWHVRAWRVPRLLYSSTFHQACNNILLQDNMFSKNLKGTRELFNVFSRHVAYYD